MVIPYGSAWLAGCACKPGRGHLRLAASAIAVAAAIASLPAWADSKNKEARNKSASFGPVVPNIATGVGNFNKQTNFVVATTPLATSTWADNRFTPPSGGGLGLSKVEIGNTGPGPSALPVTAIANGAGMKSGGAAGNDAGVRLISRESGQLPQAAGQSVELAEPGSPDSRGAVTATGQLLLDFGKIIPAPERSGIYATLAAQAGPPRANGAILAVDGRVLLTSTGYDSTRGHGFRNDDPHGHAYGRNRSEDSHSPERRSVVHDATVKVAYVYDKSGTRDDSSYGGDSYRQATSTRLPKVPVSPGQGTEESDLNVNAASVQSKASYAVDQKTDADRDATLKTSEPVATNSDKRDSNKSKSSVCS